MQYADWKNHKPADVNAQLINLFTYISCNNKQLLDAINTGKNYFQNVAEKTSNRTTVITLRIVIGLLRKRYPCFNSRKPQRIFAKPAGILRKRKIHFTKLVAQLKEENLAA